MVILALEVTGSQIWAVGGLTDLGDVMLCQKFLHKSCRMGRCIVVMKLICSLGHCEYDGHTVHKLSHRRLTATWLAPQKSDCSWMHSKVSSYWLTNYIKATRLVLEVFKMAGYFPDSPRILYCTELPLYLTTIFCHLQPLLLHACGWLAEWICSYNKWPDMKRWLIVFRENNDLLFPWHIWCNRT
jgi:hypothetical protein